MSAHVLKSVMRDGRSHVRCVNCGQGFHPELRWITPCRSDLSRPIRHNARDGASHENNGLSQ